MADRDELLDRAMRHLNTDPAASLGEVAMAAGVGRATLHRHFAGRADLVHAIGERCLEGWARTLDAAGVRTAVDAGDADTLRTCLEAYVRRLAVDAEEFAFALTEHSLTGFADLVARTEELMAVEVALFAAAQQAGVLRAGVPPRWLSHVVYGVMVAVREARRAGDADAATAGDLAVSAFLDGASA